MSTFGGKFEELPGVSVDRFTYDNLNSEAFFLSHCHVDHMQGLNSSQFQNVLLEYNLFLYVSPISKAILDKMFPSIKNNIVELELNSVKHISLKNQNLNVMTVPAGHCPGSVMFLFETNERNILYTGDFRMHPHDVKKVKAFYDSFGNKKHIYKIYMDTTFFFNRYQQFPSRKQSLDQLCTIIKKWISQGDHYIINILTSARYGYEFVFMEIFKQILMPVHVDTEQYNFYSLIPDMDQSVTKDESETQIYSSFGNKCNGINKIKSPQYKIRNIKLSAMRWNTPKLKSGIWEDDGDIIYICFSTHASFEECSELIKFLKPEYVEPCVLGDDKNQKEEIFDAIKRLLSTNDDYSPKKKKKMFTLNRINLGN